MTRKRSGFSLIELMVTLAILAGVIGIAIRSVDGFQKQNRYQQTTHSMDDVRSAIVGPANLRGPDGSAMVSGFVADTGRLPQALVSPTDPLPLLSPPQAGDPFNELLAANGIPPFQFISPAADPSISVGVGWQGPYVRLGAGQTYIRDGWGKSFGYAPNPPGTDSTITFVGSGGSDAYGQPVTLAMPGNGVGGPFAAYYGRVTMTQATDAVGPNAGYPSGPAPNATYTPASGTPSSTPVTVWVCYFGPSVSTASPPTASVVALPVQVSASSNWGFIFAAAGPVVLNGTTYTASNPSRGVFIDSRITTGPRVFKAYVIPTASPDVFNPSAAYAASLPLTVTGTGGSQTVPNLVLPHYAR